MRFLSLVKVSEDVGMPPQALFEAMGRLIKVQTESGALLETAGLRPSSEGVRVRSDGERLHAVDGPFAEAKEVIGGYAVLNAESREEALRLVQEFVQVHIDNWPGIVMECELRQIEG